MKFETRVISDDNGNRFVVPAYIITDSPDEERSKYTLWSLFLAFTTATGTKADEEWTTFDADEFPHFITSMGSRGFLHGSHDVWLIAGPKFDETMKEIADEEQRASGNSGETAR